MVYRMFFLGRNFASGLIFTLNLKKTKKNIKTSFFQPWRCLTSVSQWVAADRLKLNSEKTELLWAGSRHSAAVLGINGLSLKLGQDTLSSRHLRSANQHQLIVPRCRRITFDRRAFSVAGPGGPTVWNSLPTEFRGLSVSFGDFRRVHA